jgi:hypothetical protein
MKGDCQRFIAARQRTFPAVWDAFSRGFPQAHLSEIRAERFPKFRAEVAYDGSAFSFITMLRDAIAYSAFSMEGKAEEIMLKGFPIAH